MKEKVYERIKIDMEQQNNFVQNVWKFKLILVGTVVVFLFNDNFISEKSVDNNFWTIFILSIPLIIFILDMKLLEIGFYLNGLSRYIIKNFDGVPQQLELDTWSKGSRLRLKMKFVVINSGGTSALIVFGVIMLLSQGNAPKWFNDCSVWIYSLYSTMILIAVISTYLSWLFIFDPRSKKSLHNSECREKIINYEKTL
ncbi:hypothetical protein [Candidatus Uabimicrobium sp. HlEnr_7]|uniref:hypothetical protein n=1 Tax=Candidatus Uabimicrobium helgolandensis TaxID=3095367 RepID=UPI00355904ED